MTLVHAGQAVRPGDLLVEFDRQDQVGSFARSPGGAERFRPADPQAEGAGRRRAGGRRQHHDAGRERDLARAARDAQERDAAANPGREKHPRARGGCQVKLKALKQEIRPEAHRGPGRRGVRSNPAATAPLPANAMRQAASNAERMRMKNSQSRASPSSRPPGRATTSRRSRRGTKSAPASRSSTSSTRRRGSRVRARVNQADVRELEERPGGAGRARRLPGHVHRHGGSDFSDRRAVVAVPRRCATSSC